MFNDYEKENGKVSQYHFIKFYGIDMVLCNNIADCFDLELQNADAIYGEDDEKYLCEVFQYFIVNEKDVYLLEHLEEPIFYCNELDIYVLGFTNIGTSRDYVLTNVDLVKGKEGFYYPSL